MGDRSGLDGTGPVSQPRTVSNLGTLLRSRRAARTLPGITIVCIGLTGYAIAPTVVSLIARALGGTYYLGHALAITSVSAGGGALSQFPRRDAADAAAFKRNGAGKT